LVQLTDSLARLQHVYTGRLLPSFINVDKLRHLKDVDRNVLYNRYLKRSPTDDNEDVNIPEQRTIQCVNTPSGHWSHGSAVNILQLLRASASTYAPADLLNSNYVLHEPEAYGLRLGEKGNCGSRLTQLGLSEGTITNQMPTHTENSLTLSAVVNGTEEACCKSPKQMALNRSLFNNVATETDASHLLDCSSTADPLIESHNRAIQVNQHEQPKLRQQPSPITYNDQGPFVQDQPLVPTFNPTCTWQHTHRGTCETITHTNSC
jgi:hypothetical protein